MKNLYRDEAKEAEAAEEIKQENPVERFERLFKELKLKNTLFMREEDLAFMDQHIMGVLNNPKEKDEYKNHIKTALKTIKQKMVRDILREKAMFDRNPDPEKSMVFFNRMKGIYTWGMGATYEISLAKLLSIERPLIAWGRKYTRSVNTASLEEVADALTTNIRPDVATKESLLQNLKRSIETEENYLEAKEHLKAMIEAVARQPKSHLDEAAKNKILQSYSDWKHDKELWQQFLYLYLHGHIDTLPGNVLPKKHTIYERAQNALHWLASDNSLKNYDELYQYFFDIFSQTCTNKRIPENEAIELLLKMPYDTMIVDSEGRERTRLAFIVWSIKNNQLENLKKLKPEGIIAKDNLCELAISFGHINILRYLLEKLENERTFGQNPSSFIRNILKHSINHGKSAIQEYFFDYCSEKYKPHLPQVYLSHNEEALFIAWAIKNRRFEILMLRGYFNHLSQMVLSKEDKEPLIIFAIQNNNLKLLKLLVDTLEADALDAMVEKNKLFEATIKRGHLNILKYLLERKEKPSLQLLTQLLIFSLDFKESNIKEYIQDNLFKHLNAHREGLNIVDMADISYEYKNLLIRKFVELDQSPALKNFIRLIGAEAPHKISKEEETILLELAVKKKDMEILEYLLEIIQPTSEVLTQLLVPAMPAAQKYLFECITKKFNTREDVSAFLLTSAQLKLEFDDRLVSLELLSDFLEQKNLVEQKRLFLDECEHIIHEWKQGIHLSPSVDDKFKLNLAVKALIINLNISTAEKLEQKEEEIEEKTGLEGEHFKKAMRSYRLSIMQYLGQSNNNFVKLDYVPSMLEKYGFDQVVWNKETLKMLRNFYQESDEQERPFMDQMLKYLFEKAVENSADSNGLAPVQQLHEVEKDVQSTILSSCQLPFEILVSNANLALLDFFLKTDPYAKEYKINISWLDHAISLFKSASLEMNASEAMREKRLKVIEYLLIPALNAMFENLGMNLEELLNYITKVEQQTAPNNAQISSQIRNFLEEKFEFYMFIGEPAQADKLTCYYKNKKDQIPFSFRMAERLKENKEYTSAVEVYKSLIHHPRLKEEEKMDAYAGIAQLILEGHYQEIDSESPFGEVPVKKQDEGTEAKVGEEKETYISSLDELNDSTQQMPEEKKVLALLDRAMQAYFFLFQHKVHKDGLIIPHIQRCLHIFSGDDNNLDLDADDESTIFEIDPALMPKLIAYVNSMPELDKKLIGLEWLAEISTRTSPKALQHTQLEQERAALIESQRALEQENVALQHQLRLAQEALAAFQNASRPVRTRSNSSSEFFSQVHREPSSADSSNSSTAFHAPPLPGSG